ncbi:ATP-binding protein [Azospirillum sp.]|uniref:sensor histidine kinase n=1 Tax=Azospirillum sp. TaxID=34012 RepID=UPI003D75CC3E
MFERGGDDPSALTIYRPVSLRGFRDGGSLSDRILIVALWLATIAAGIGLGLASIVYEWSGVPLHFGGTDVYVTIYPPLVFAAFWVLWFGFWWGFLPAYLSTLALALYSGMPVGWSLIFAFADPVGLAVFAIAYRAIPVPHDLRSLNAVLFFVLLSFVGGVFGSTGSFIWITTSNVGAQQVLPIWQGWWLGAFLQNLAIVAPALALLGPAVMRWRSTRWAGAGHADVTARHTLGGAALILGGVLLFLYLSVRLNIDAFETPSASGAATLVESTRAIYWVMTVIIVFASYFGYQLFTQWMTSVTRSTEELSAANARLAEQTEALTAALDSERVAHEQLKAAQAHLVQAEKMASLGSLVAGVAHEINTPLGIALTATSHLGDETVKLEKLSGEAKLRKVDFERYVGIARETTGLVQSHIARAAGLVQSFKQLASDQVADDRRRFRLREWLEDLATGLKPAWRKAGHVMSIDCPDGIEIDGYPGALAQVLTNLVMNSLDHGFGEGQTGNLLVTVSTPDPRTVEVVYTDDGRGIAADCRAKVFDPFFTTKRSSGNTGLGLHIVFNLVTARLGGWIELDGAARAGVRFVVRFPRVAPQPAPQPVEADSAA